MSKRLTAVRSAVGVDGVPAPKPMQVPLPWADADQTIFARASAAARPVTPQQPRRCHSEPSTPVVRPIHTYPTVFVSVPRAVADRYGQLPWVDVVSAAERGVDGLVVVYARPVPWLGRICDGPPREPNVAFLAEGQDNWRGRTVLFQQNW
jgi:hypothetical protein